jgi:predicted naringenin-chalcone synthase
MYLESVGTGYPVHALTVSDRHQIAELYVHGDAKDRSFVQSMFEKTGIQTRPSVLLTSSEGDLRDRQSFFPPLDQCETGRGPSTGQRMLAYQKYAPELAIMACENAFLHSQVLPEDITHMVTASCTGFVAPGFDLDLINSIPLAQSVRRTHLGFMGCHAGLNCLRVASAFASADPTCRVLVCATELCGLHYQYMAQADQMIANALFSDGAGAAIVTGEMDTIEQPQWKFAGEASYVIPGTSELMTWNIDDFGFTMTLSNRIPDVIKREAGPWLRHWLAENGLAVTDIAGWAVHPGGPQILNAFEIAMKLDSSAIEPSRKLLAEKGNMSSASIFFLLKSLRESGECLPCVAVGFGPGLTIEAALFR